MTAPVLLRPKDACALLSISDKTLRRLCADGRIEVRYITVRSKQAERRIVAASLNAYVESLPLDPPVSA